MKSTESQRKEMVLLAFLAAVAIALVTVALVPSLRQATKNLFFEDDRVILAKTTALLTDGPPWTILKILKGERITLEIYRPNEQGQLTLITTLPLEDRKDGHFVYQGNALSLTALDVDKDGALEIVAPTYNEQLVPRLNIFRYNKDTESFDRATAPADFQL